MSGIDRQQQQQQKLPASSIAPPPQLIFDDGSRIMQEEALIVSDSSGSSPDDLLSSSSLKTNPRGTIPLHEFYEMERISQEILKVFLTTESVGESTPPKLSPEPRILRVALQFPDELLVDSPEVCWLLNDQLRQDLIEWDQSDHNRNDHDRQADQKESIHPFCFVLGDTTVNSCCPDEVAALHLNADVLVHYGHACLSPTGRLPVLYSFGKLNDMEVNNAVEQLEAARQKEIGDNSSNNVLIIYQVGYHHAVEELRTAWIEMYDKQESNYNELRIVMGQIPKPRTSKLQSSIEPVDMSTSCCRSNESTSCTISDEKVEAVREKPSRCVQSSSCAADFEIPSDTRPLIVGGLELPMQISSWDVLFDYTILFIMSDPSIGSGPQHRQYVNSMLCFLSLPSPPRAYWIYTPSTNSLTSDASPPLALQRQLKRRFFLTQKTRDAQVIGILVSNLSQQHLVKVVQVLQKIIHDAGKTSYSFAVGKINPAKLANFAEIDVFCLVACREHSLLDHEQEYPVPVITPMELEIALGKLEWGAQAYSLDCQDVMTRQSSTAGKDIQENPSHADYLDDSDAPYFSLVTGGYVSKTIMGSGDNALTDLDLKNLPGQGQVMEYKSEAAMFLKRREYQGLESLVGETEAKSAVQGLIGIASDYSGT